MLTTENEDIRSLRELITYSLKGLAAYTKYAIVEVCIELCCERGHVNNGNIKRFNKLFHSLLIGCMLLIICLTVGSAACYRRYQNGNRALVLCEIDIVPRKDILI